MNKFEDTRYKIQINRNPKKQIRILNLGFGIFWKSFLVSCLLSPAFTRAQSIAATPDLKSLDRSFVVDSSYSYLISNMISRIPYYLGGLALLAIMYSGALYILALGDPTKMESAKKNITWTVTGILAVFAMYAIIAVVAWLGTNTL